MMARLFTRVAMLSVVLILTSVGSTFAQEKEPDGIKGRLPPYFKDVVNEQQKASIYKIQSQFDEKLKTLEARFKTLTEELKALRDEIDGIKAEERAAVEAVLTKPQVTKIKKLQAEAQVKMYQDLLKAAEEAAKRAEALTDAQ